jgi:hypothetical protein
MDKIYKQYEIEITTRKLQSGEWTAYLMTTPIMPAIHGIELRGKYNTQEEAENAGFEWAKKRIDQKGQTLNKSQK